ncbi:putative lipid II flippase FtsW [uncultured Clostridium sp.]|jgi:cell division protein FtsW|uniref:putative lipid II flippase FtsW n=1 Tax=uncultured Clostridium sp. TaxID=59620 RepID=UPI0026185B9E|nr:putative lipid II flippase FtsW [uncultured Clostridium sp.]
MKVFKGLFKKDKYDNFDFILFATIIVLLSFGIIMVYSASFYKAIISEDNSMYFFIRQAGFGFIGFCGMVLISRIDYKKYRKFARLGLIVSFIAIGITILKIPGITHSAYGATRWLKFGPITVQPSEFVKYAVVLFAAVELSRMGIKIKSFRKGVLPVLLGIVFFAGMIVAQKSLSIAIVTGVSGIILIFAAGAKIKHMLLIFSSAIPVLIGAIALEPFRIARVFNFVDPWKDAAGKGYQVIQSFYALGSGGVVGLGLGESRQKTMYMPEPHNDFIFSIIGEELGLIGCVFVIVLFLIFIYRGIIISVTAKDVYGTLLALGITSIIAIQAIINIAVVTGSMPVTGVPLPFISYGGTALVINLFAMGILLNISRQCEKRA